MSKPWKPPRSNVVRFGARRWTEAEAYWRETAPHRQMPTGAKVGLVIVAAACLGIGIGWYQAFGPRDIVADEVAIVPKAEPVVPEFAADPADSEWAAKVAESERPSTSSGRAEGEAIRARFSYCKWGGGTNCAVDGDTVWIGGRNVRIAGIDAPETHDYRCESELELGERAARQLQALLNSGAVTMTSIDRDRDVYGRLLRNLSVNGSDVGDALIASGVARPYAGGRRSWCGGQRG